MRWRLFVFVDGKVGGDEFSVLGGGHDADADPGGLGPPLADDGLLEELDRLGATDLLHGPVGTALVEVYHDRGRRQRRDHGRQRDLRRRYQGSGNGDHRRHGDRSVDRNLDRGGDRGVDRNVDRSGERSGHRSSHWSGDGEAAETVLVDLRYLR